MTEEEIRMMLTEGKQQGTIQTEENQMIQNIFEFDDTSADQVSTHRREITFLWLKVSVKNGPGPFRKVVLHTIRSVIRIKMISWNPGYQKLFPFQR